MKIKGSVKFFDSAKGWGFIEVVGENDIFLHVKDLKAARIDLVEPGDKLMFNKKDDSKGVRAVDVERG